MRFIIKAKNTKFTGERAGVDFVKGEAKTDDKQAVEWFKQRDYEVYVEPRCDENPQTPAIKPEPAIDTNANAQESKKVYEAANINQPASNDKPKQESKKGK